jgi:predicted methyltransferase
MNFKCSLCKGEGHTNRWTEQWVKSRNKKSLLFKSLVNIDFFKTKTCDYCIGTGIDLNRMSTNILIKSGW